MFKIIIGDIAGGRGHLLRAILEAAPESKGVLFDLPHVMKEASVLASPRLTLQAGDFFKDALPRCDAYILMEIIHDWPDEEAATILQAVRRAAVPRRDNILDRDDCAFWSRARLVEDARHPHVDAAWRKAAYSAGIQNPARAI